jgi:GTPase SAR1 family protein
MIPFVIKKFDINNIDVNQCILIVGNKGVGKTSLVKHIVNNKKDIKSINALSSIYDKSVVIDTYEDFGKRILILDDVNLEHKVELHKLFVNKTHSDVLTLISLESSYNIPIVIKNNVDYVFIYKCDDFKKIYWEKISNIFEDLLKDYKISNLYGFLKILNDITIDKYTAIVIDIKNHKLFWYKS